jgi:hypothetical protein
MLKSGGSCVGEILLLGTILRNVDQIFNPKLFVSRPLTICWLTKMNGVKIVSVLHKKHGHGEFLSMCAQDGEMSPRSRVRQSLSIECGRRGRERGSESSHPSRACTASRLVVTIQSGGYSGCRTDTGTRGATGPFKRNWAW